MKARNNTQQIYDSKLIVLRLDSLFDCVMYH